MFNVYPKCFTFLVNKKRKSISRLSYWAMKKIEGHLVAKLHDASHSAFWSRLFLASLWISDEFQLQDSVIKAEKNITSFRQENLLLELDLFQLWSYYVQGPPQNHWFVIFLGSQATGKVPEHQPRTQCPTFKKGSFKNSGILGCLNGQVCCISCCLQNSGTNLQGPRGLTLFSPAFLLVSSLSHWDHSPASVLPAPFFPALSGCLWVSWKKLPDGANWYHSTFVFNGCRLFHNVAKQHLKNFVVVSNLSSSWKPYFILSKLFISLCPLHKSSLTVRLNWNECSVDPNSPALCLGEAQHLKWWPMGPIQGHQIQGRSNYPGWSRSGRGNVIFFFF